MLIEGQVVNYLAFLVCARKMFILGFGWAVLPEFLCAEKI